MDYRAHLIGVVGRITVLEYVHILTLGTYEYVTLRGKAGLRLQTELRLLLS